MDRMANRSKRRKPARRDSQCPCGVGNSFESCCQPVLGDSSVATCAEQLMRSRYTAYVRGDVEHLRRTWHTDSRPDQIGFDSSVRWLGLRIVSSSDGGPDDLEGQVEFIAEFRHEHLSRELHELSHFVRQHGRWTYLSGTLINN